MSEAKVLPLPKVKGVWKNDLSKYPDLIRVAMSDGRVITYRIDIEQPAPVLREKLDRFREMCIGYEKPADAATSNRPQRKNLHLSISQKGDSDK